MSVKSAGAGHFQIPTAPAALTAVQQSGSANTLGSAVSFGNSPSAMYITGVTIGVATTQTPTYVQIQILVAASIVASVLVPYGVSSAAANSVVTGFRPIFPPIPVANGAAITVKSASSVASAVSWGVSLECIAQSNVVDDGITVTTVGTVTTVTNQLTAAAIATGVWQDATAGDFTTASSIGKALYISNVAPGASGGHMISGSNAGTTTLGALTITGVTTHTGNMVLSDGLTISAPSTADRAGIDVTGNGAGAAFKLAAGATGKGIAITTTAGDGLSILPTAGHAIVATGQGTTKHGIFATGSATTGAGIAAAGGGTSGDGVLISATSGHGMNIAGGGTTKHGINAVGGATTSAGIAATGGATSGDGILAAGGGGGHGMSLNGVGTIKHGLSSTTSSTGGSGAKFIGGSGAGEGIWALGGNGAGLRCTGAGTSTDGIRADGASGGNGFSASGASGGYGISALGSAGGRGLSCVGGNASGATPAGPGFYSKGGTASTTGGGIAGVGTQIIGGTGAASTNGAGDAITATGGGTVTVAGGNAMTLTATGDKNGLEAVGAGTGADILADITGNLSGSVGSLTTNNDKTGYVLSAAGSAALTESYAADGAAPTLGQILYMIWGFAAEKNLSGTTLTVKKLDGSTSAMTFTLDSSTAPTSITRAT